MSATKLIIKNYESTRLKDGSCIIFLRYSYKNKVTLFSTKESIHPKDWNKKEGAVKKSYKGHLHLNEYLQSFKTKIDNIIRTARLSEDPDDEPTSEYVKRKYLDKQSKKTESIKKKISFFDFVKQYIAESENTKRPHTIKGYKGTERYLLDYQKARNIKLDWESFDMRFYNDLKKYFIEERGWTNNTIGKAIKNLKVFLSEGRERKINNYDDYKSKNFITLSAASDSIYLNDDEIDVLRALDLSNDKKMDQVRDIFVLACCCGLRYADFSRLKPINFVDNSIKIVTSKTNTPLDIPLHRYIVEIREKYKDEEDGLPKFISNQKLNKYLKDLGKLASFNRAIEISIYKGAKVIKETKQAWELITVHTARRSFATNLFKSGYPTIRIMKITGHTTERAFLKYIKIGLEENSKMLEAHWKKIEDEKKDKPNNDQGKTGE